MSTEIHKLSGGFESIVPWRPLSHDLGGSEVALTAEIWNSPEHTKEFLKRTSVGRIELPISDSVLDLTVSDTPYSKNHLMLVMSNEEVINRRSWYEGVIVHERNMEERVAYWLTAIEAYKNLEKEANENDLLLFSENTCCRVTDDKYRLPRSLGLIHGHVTNFSEEKFSFTNYSLDVEGLDEERSYWNNIGKQFTERINTGIEPNSLVNPSIEFSKDGYPHGYQIQIPEANDNLQTALVLSEVLRKHHQSYNFASSQYNGFIKPQPSYRTYFQFDTGKVIVSISPIIISHAGSINAADIDLTRIHDESMDMVERRLEDKKKYETIIHSVKNQLKLS